jgi:hypothetical protein
MNIEARPRGDAKPTPRAAYPQTGSGDTGLEAGCLICTHPACGQHVDVGYTYLTSLTALAHLPVGWQSSSVLLRTQSSRSAHPSQMNMAFDLAET